MINTACKQCGAEGLDHNDDCPAGAFGRVRLTAGAVRNQEREILRLADEVTRLKDLLQQLQEENERVRKMATVINLRETVAHALVFAYRDAQRVGMPPGESSFVLGILRELDALYKRAPFDPPPQIIPDA